MPHNEIREAVIKHGVIIENLNNSVEQLSKISLQSFEEMKKLSVTILKQEQILERQVKQEQASKEIETRLNKRIEKLENSNIWLFRLITSTVITAVVAYFFQQ